MTGCFVELTKFRCFLMNLLTLYYTPLSVSRLHGSWLQPRAHWSVYLERKKSFKKFDHRFSAFRLQEIR